MCVCVCVRVYEPTENFERKTEREGPDLFEVLADVDDSEEVWIFLETKLSGESQLCLQTCTCYLDGQVREEGTVVQRLCVRVCVCVCACVCVWSIKSEG